MRLRRRMVAGALVLFCVCAGLVGAQVASADTEACPGWPEAYRGADVVVGEVHSLREDLVQSCRGLKDLTNLYGAIGELWNARPTVGAVDGVRGAVEALRGDVADVSGALRGQQALLRDQQVLLERIAVATEGLDMGGAATVVRLDGVDAAVVGDAAQRTAETLNENFWYLAGLLCGLFAGAQMLRRMLP